MTAQQQTGGSTQTTNPQTVPVSDLQPQQSGLQGSVGQVLGTSTLLEQTSNAAISVNGQSLEQEIGEIQTQSESSNKSVNSYLAGKESYVMAFAGLLIGVLAYVFMKQIMREHSSE